MIKLILAFHSDIKRRYDTCTIRITELQIKLREGRGFSGGIWDDEDERKEQERLTRLQCAYEYAIADKNKITAEWKLVKKIFGENACNLAMTEREQAIGDLPFVD